ncbi:MAG: alpha-1,2-fucosyltransferase [Candidatus Staskawiczbacteria bacterium]|nr:alpha-1,2-fucosyltransferase [Candidatus Staskawiczbacteria bacterium]
MIIVRLSGGMGNQMFQYAIGRKLALQYGVELKLDTSFLLDRTPRLTKRNSIFRDYDLDVFNISAQIARRSEIPPMFRMYFSGKTRLILDFIRRRFIFNPGKEKFSSFDGRIFSVGPQAYLEGYWQSPKYFADIEGIIKKDFTLKAPLSHKAQVLFEQIQSHNSVCINVRRGDFVNSSFHRTFGQDYYQKGVNKIKESSPIDKIYIFSDDIEWCRNNLSFPFPCMIVGHEYAGSKFEEYLFLMSACKYFVIPNSSFAWWAAWFCDNKTKQVITPRQWSQDQSVNKNDIVPKEWITI